MKPTHTKSWARNLLMLDLSFGPSFKLNHGSLALVSCLSVDTNTNLHRFSDA